MILVNPSHEILTEVDGDRILQRIEAAGRTCYKSEEKITRASNRPFVAHIIASGHHSVIEHESISVRFICDRGVTHEIVRHRLAAYSQESTRYCNYKGGVTFVIPPWLHLGGINPGEYEIAWDGLYGTIDTYNNIRSWVWTDDKASLIWFWNMAIAERDYKKLLANGWSPQQARTVLPNSLKTEIVMTANLREWRHVLKLRTSTAAHPQMRKLMMPLLIELQARIPIIFNDIIDQV